MINYCNGTYNYEGIRIPERGDMTNKTPTNGIKDAVHKWLMDDGWKVGKRTFPEAAWAFKPKTTSVERLLLGKSRIGKMNW